MANASLFAAFERMWHHILLKLEERGTGVTSWNDLTDRPFGNEAGIEITFDPKTHTEPPVGTIDSKSIYFVSDKIISNEELKNATYETVYVNTDDPSQTTIVAEKLNAEDWARFEQLGFVTEDYALLPSVFVIIRKNNTTLPLTDFVFERQGVYALYEANTNYVRKITTPAQVKTLDPMFLPMADIVNEVLTAIPDAEGASF
jgi:hypothetical protein